MESTVLSTGEFKQYLTNAIKNSIDQWEETDIYAISFYIHTTRFSKNIPTLSMCYNTESLLKDPDLYGEERWNIVYWFGGEYPIIGNNIEDTDEAAETTKKLLQWYKDIGIQEPGVMKPNKDFGPLPDGVYKFYRLIVEIAKKLHPYINKKFKKPMPLLINDLEYSLLDRFCTLLANQNDEAIIFLDAMDKLDYAELWDFKN